MVLVCGNSALDLDRLNAYAPDGGQAFCMFGADTHKLENIPKKAYGTFARAEDGGIIYFADIAFKMLADLSAKAGLENVKYLRKEFARAEAAKGGGRAMSRPDPKGPLGAALAAMGVRNALLPDDTRVVACNLKALQEYDMIKAMCLDAPYIDRAYLSACLDMIDFLGGYIYMGRGHKSLAWLHKALCELFRTLGLDEFKDFVEDFYALADRIPAGRYGEAAKEAVADKDNELAEAVAETDTDANTEPEDDTGSAAEKIPENAAKAGELFAHKLKTVSGADIAGLDETYAARYCEALYEKDLESADSEGFLEKLIAARANGGAAPIDLLSEAIAREHSHDNQANVLRRNMRDIRENIEEAAAAASE